jgi:hypothetical protein
MTHTRGWSWRQLGYCCRQCGLPWRRGQSRCLDAPTYTPWSRPAPAAAWTGPTTLMQGQAPLMTAGQRLRANEGRW